jgi:predicted negative regulator of RcsB-dependent stress response
MKYLFEITYDKTILNLNGDHLITQRKKYQVVAENRYQAAFEFGQTFHNSDAYEIKIISVGANKL